MEINHNHVIVKKSHDYGWFPFALSSFVPQLEPQPQPLTTTTTTATTKATTTTTITTIDNKSPWVFFLFLYALLIFFSLATKIITSTTSTTTHYYHCQCHLPPTNLQPTQHRNGDNSNSSWGPGSSRWYVFFIAGTFFLIIHTCLCGPLLRMAWMSPFLGNVNHNDSSICIEYKWLVQHFHYLIWRQ